MVRFAPAAICELDYRNNRFIVLNDVACAPIGYFREEILDLNPSDLFDREGRELCENRMNQWLGGNEPEFQVDYKARTKGGRDLYVSLNISFTRDDKGEPLGAMVIAHDITLHGKVEGSLRKIKKKLRYVNKKCNLTG